jgi:bifunctional DNA-binding transcriptional regulator/antitoxin component of YhaV-PrlF toxin-antitoxin module
VLQSTLTDKGQTTVPHAVRKALKVKARQQLEWTIRSDGSALVRPRPMASDLFGSLKSVRFFPGLQQEKEAVKRAVGEQAAKEGIE